MAARKRKRVRGKGRRPASKADERPYVTGARVLGEEGWEVMRLGSWQDVSVLLDRLALDPGGLMVLYCPHQSPVVAVVSHQFWRLRWWRGQWSMTVYRRRSGYGLRTPRRRWWGRSPYLSRELVEEALATFWRTGRRKARLSWQRAELSVADAATRAREQIPEEWEAFSWLEEMFEWGTEDAQGEGEGDGA